jgi:hypothetical protein
VIIRGNTSDVDDNGIAPVSAVAFVVAVVVVVAVSVVVAMPTLGVS